MNKRRTRAARYAAELLKRTFGFDEKLPLIGVILGTGWGEVLSVENAQEQPFEHIPDFKHLPCLEGHKRQIVYGQIAGKNVIILRGRLHLNEIPFSKRILKLVRLQTEMLLAAGVKQLIITSAVGSLKPTPPVSQNFDNRPLIPGPDLSPSRLNVGDVAVVDGFISLFAPPLPLWGGEFISPEDAISENLSLIALQSAKEVGLEAQKTGMAMVRGPQFEGRKYDKKILSLVGAGVVGMSMLPEAAIASLYGAKILGLGFVTNDDEEIHSHLENLARAEASAEKLGAYLTKIISQM